MEEMHVTLYRGARAPVPIDQAEFDTWAEFVAAMRDVVSAAGETKEELLAIGPHRLEPAYRRNENVQAVTLMALDVDRVDDLDALIERVPGPALIYASPSDTPEARRVRILAPIDRELTPEECRPARIAFAESLGLAPGCGVEGALEPARIFFAGHIAGTPARDIWEIDG